jgi:chloramphenicol O-acetyltransferase
MTIVLNLIERVKEEYYNTEYLDYEESKISFTPVEENPNLNQLNLTVNNESYDDFLKKYPSSVRSVLKEKDKISKRDLCFYVSKHNQEKAHNLLFKILKERMRWWWD